MKQREADKAKLKCRALAFTMSRKSGILDSLMKRLYPLILGLLLAGPMITQAGIKGKNAMGSVRVDIFPGKWHLLSIPLTNPDGSGVTTVQDLFSDESLFPSGTLVALYDNLNQQFDPNSESRFFFGWDPGNLNLEQRAFWLFVPDDGQPSPFSLHLIGNVPDADQLPVFSHPVAASGMGHNFIPNPYPAVQEWTNTTLSSAAFIGDLLVPYDPETGYIDGATLFFFGWDPSDYVLIPGLAYYFRSSSNLTWMEPKPYSWP